LLCDALKNIMLQTKAPIKYLIATSVLKVTESGINWAGKDESNIISLLKVVKFNIKMLDE